MVALVGSNEGITIVASPLSIVAVPSDLVPWVNETVPVGTSLSELDFGTTTADTVTGTPENVGSGFADSETLVGRAVLETTWVRLSELDPKKASPGYVAVRVEVPDGNADVTSVASPVPNVPPSSVTVPRSSDPSVNVTRPVGETSASDEEPTEAVSVTGSPTVEGFGVDCTVTDVANGVDVTVWVIDAELAVKNESPE
jgi:hypothetical protein